MKKLFVLIAVCTLLVGCNNNDGVIITDESIPVITLNGEHNITLEVGSEYTELNAVALLNDEQVDVVVTGSVNVNVLGEYQIKYNAESDSNLVADEVVRIINVVDTTAPSISFSEQDNYIYEVGTPFPYESIITSDNYNNVIDIEIVTTGIFDTDELGSYELSFKAVDTEGNESDIITKIIRIVDTTAPVIAFSELDDFTHELGSPFSYNQIVKTDNYDIASDIEITMTGSIDINILGSYELSFQAVDTEGNESNIITKTVVVEAREDLDYYHRFMKENTSLYDPNPFLATYLYDELERVYRGVVLNNGEYEVVYYFFLHNVYEDGGMLEKIEFVCPDASNHVYELEDTQLDYVFRIPMECVRNTSIYIITYAHDDFVSSTRSWTAKLRFESEDNISANYILTLELDSGNLK